MITNRNENSDATRATCPRHIWIAYVEDAAMARGVSAEWLREPVQRQRINRAYSEGETVWMEADAVWMFWRGYQMAIVEQADGLALIRRAVTRG